MSKTPEIILEAIRRVRIEDVCGVDLHGTSPKVGPCPICMPGVKRGDCFKVYGETWKCYRGGCGKGGDVVSLESILARVGMVEAARRLLGGDWHDRPEPERVEQVASEAEAADQKRERMLRYAAEMWKAREAFAGSLAETYMAGRGIVPAVLAAMAPNLGYHPRARWYWNPGERRWATAPAMLALCVVAGEGGRPVATGGVHATYLRADGSGKATPPAAHPKVKAKRMWGPQSLDGRPGGTWLIGPAGHGLADETVGAEGIETSASMASLHVLDHGRVPRAWAALSLDRLQGLLATDDDRCVDLEALAAKPGSAFVWPGVDDVTLGIDRDMGPIEVTARTGRGKPCPMVLDGEARSLMSARMAVAAWRAAGSRRVSARAPRPGMDFNNELMRRLQAQTGATA